MIHIADTEYSHSVQDVLDSVEGYFHEGKSEDVFALKQINIKDVLDMNRLPIEMTDEMIIANNDQEYIEQMISHVMLNGTNSFEAVVVIDRGDHYEWLDGQHRMTALVRAGVNVTLAYVQKSI